MTGDEDRLGTRRRQAAVAEFERRQRELWRETWLQILGMAGMFLLVASVPFLVPWVMGLATR